MSVIVATTVPPPHFTTTHKITLFCWFFQGVLPDLCWAPVTQVQRKVMMSGTTGKDFDSKPRNMHKDSCYAFKTVGKRNVSSYCSRVVKSKVNEYVETLDESRSRKQLKNQTDKDTKIDALPVIHIDPNTNACKSAWNQLWKKTNKWKSIVFVSGTRQLDPPHLPRCDGVWSAQTDLLPFQDLGGGHMEGVCTLVPRSFILETFKEIRNFPIFHSKFAAATEVSPAIPKAKRHTAGGHRQLVFEDENYTYVITGKVQDQGKRGIHNKELSEKINPNVRGWIARYLSKMEHAALAYMDTNTIVSLELLKKVLGYNGIDVTGNGPATRLMPACAFSNNSYVNIHVDVDFSVCILSILAPKELVEESDVLVYFSFPSTGRSIGLRNGDVLIFNPQIPHCMSSRRFPDVDVMCVAMYWKTSFAGRNDNDLDVDEIKTLVLK